MMDATVVTTSERDFVVVEKGKTRWIACSPGSSLNIYAKDPRKVSSSILYREEKKLSDLDGFLKNTSYLINPARTKPSSTAPFAAAPARRASFSPRRLPML